MSTNYNAKKKPELEALLKERGLAHTGNKADLVARLQENDAAKDAGSAPAPTAAAADEDKIDWDDDDTNAAPSNLAAAQATDEPAHKAALEAGGVGRVDNPVDVPNQVVDEANEPGKTDDLVEHAPATSKDSTAAATEQPSKEEAEAAKKAYEEKFGANLAASEADKEAEKRRKRALRFPGMAEANADADKAAERAKRFGTGADDSKDDKLAKALDSALPEKRERKRGRERADVGRGGGDKRVDSRRRDQRPRGPGKPQNQMSEADRLALEKRRARFNPSS